MMKIPETIKPGDLQCSGNHNGLRYEVYYDDKASSCSEVNMYAVFSTKGFHCWIELGFSQSEINSALEINPTDNYKNSIADYKKRMKNS